MLSDFCPEPQPVVVLRIGVSPPMTLTIVLLLSSGTVPYPTPFRGRVLSSPLSAFQVLGVILTISHHVHLHLLILLNIF